MIHVRRSAYRYPSQIAEVALNLLPTLDEPDIESNLDTGSSDCRNLYDVDIPVGLYQNWRNSFSTSLDSELEGGSKGTNKWLCLDSKKNQLNQSITSHSSSRINQ